MFTYGVPIGVAATANLHLTYGAMIIVAFVIFAWLSALVLVQKSESRHWQSELISPNYQLLRIDRTSFDRSSGRDSLARTSFARHPQMFSGIRKH
jgi:hypothetical protein